MDAKWERGNIATVWQKTYHKAFSRMIFFVIFYLNRFLLIHFTQSLFGVTIMITEQAISHYLNQWDLTLVCITGPQLVNDPKFEIETLQLPCNCCTTWCGLIIHISCLTPLDTDDKPWRICHISQDIGGLNDIHEALAPTINEMQKYHVFHYQKLCGQTSNNKQIYFAKFTSFNKACYAFQLYGLS